MQDTFYNRLDFYRMLEAGVVNLNEVASMYKTTLRTVQRWKKQFDPSRGPYGLIEDVQLPDNTINLQFMSPENGRHDIMSPEVVASALEQPDSGTRAEIVAAVRQAALNGNMQAAKLLLTEYEPKEKDGEEILTVDRALQLLDEWQPKS